MAFIIEKLWEQSVEDVGLPSRKRYNVFVGAAANESKLGGDMAKAQVMATLALAEATLLTEEH